MKITLVCIGKLKTSWIEQGCDEYLQRLRLHHKLDFVELAKPEQLLSFLAEKKGIWVLDEGGKSYTSIGFAKKIEEYQNHGGATLFFVIGGADGIDKKYLPKDCLYWSLSELTFPHRVVRVLVLEQLYRAFSILAGTPYHRE